MAGALVSTLTVCSAVVSLPARSTQVAVRVMRPWPSETVWVVQVAGSMPAPSSVQFQSTVTSPSCQPAAFGSGDTVGCASRAAVVDVGDGDRHLALVGVPVVVDAVGERVDADEAVVGRVVERAVAVDEHGAVGRLGRRPRSRARRSSASLANPARVSRSVDVAGTGERPVAGDRGGVGGQLERPAGELPASSAVVVVHVQRPRAVRVTARERSEPVPARARAGRFGSACSRLGAYVPVPTTSFDLGASRGGAHRRRRR